MKTLVLLFTLLSTQAFAGADCEGVCGKEIATELNSPLLEALNNITNFSGEGFPETMANDPRLVRSKSSPKWLAAVGRLVSNTSATKKEQCSLSIIADAPGKDGIIAVTAGHCVDHWVDGNGGFEVGHNETTFKTNSGKTIKRSISKVLKAETHKGDYAIVKLNAPIKYSDIKPLLNAPYDYYDLLDKDLDEANTNPYATMAGYSADRTKGQKGKVLTYHEKCQLNGGASGMKKGYCTSYQGASGGAVVVTATVGDMADETWQETEQSYFVGSIVGGRAGDDNDKTMFTDTSYYSKTLDKILADH
ncbi:MAG: hypothetical protein CME70_03835 [Halobacteriovorax sp.]|nr:hypothetical protein [Halobacteriovorax sp.]|tara:strand:- start:149924 stop:150838 length:915 start_codon:yes stop_codon:yes gene_type:complete